MLTDRIAMTVVTPALFVVTVVVNTVRQDRKRRERERRGSEMLRTGILTEDGVQVRIPTGVYSWNSSDDPDETNP